MAVSLVGEVVNNCDAVTGFENTPNISGDDAFVEGTAALGKKVSATTVAMGTTTLGAGAPYDFSSGGAEDGYHLILWFNAKTPIHATSGFRFTVGDGTNRGEWDVVEDNYTGGYVPKVINTARNFDRITAGSWATTSNPSQLTAVSVIGPTFQTTTSIMGSFNNVNMDQFTTGLGLRVDAGTGGSPNTFETVRAADEGGSIWGWWTSKNGAFVGRGKLYIGPASGTATSVFTDSTFSVVFAKELVAAGFYAVETRGTNTDVTWTLANVSAADASVARWSLIVDSTTKTFVDNDGVFSGADQLTLNATSSLLGTKLVNCTRLTQNGATLTGIAVQAANTGDGVAFIASGAPNLISASSFAFSDGHAIEITTPGTYNFVGNVFTGSYGGTPGSNLTASSGSTDAMIYNNSGGGVTLNISGGGTLPSVRNAASSTTTVNNTVTLSVHVEDEDGTAIVGAEVYVQKTTPTAYTSGAGNTAGDADLVVTQAIDSDTPTTGTVNVLDISEQGGIGSGVQSYRYVSWATSTFTFPAAVSFNCTGGGTGTLLQDSVNDFTALNIAEGDTVRNTTDGSWARVDTITDANNITTTPLRGGSDNTWTSGDTYQFHRLATPLVSGTDTVDVPILLGATNGSGNATKSFPYVADRAVTIRVRHVDGATKYVPNRSSSTIASTGMATSVVLQKDTVYA